MALLLRSGPPKMAMPLALGGDYCGRTRVAKLPCGFSSSGLAVTKLKTSPCRTPLKPGPIVSMALPFDLSPHTTASAVAITSLLSFATVRAVVYFRMQYIIAAMLSRHVPRGGAKVLDLNIHEGRNLYYYPKDTVQVVTASPKFNTQILDRQAVNAGVPITVKTRPLDDLGMPANSMDAVVSVYSLCEVADDNIPGVLREAVRILKPGKPLIFVENVGAKGELVRAAQTLLDSVSKTVGSTRRYSRGLLRYIQETEGLEELSFEEVLDFQDPHLVGVAKKKMTAPTSVTGSVKEAAGKKRSKKTLN